MVLSVLLGLTVVVVTARLLGELFKRLNQPAVIGEIVGGILLGPSLLGRVSPAAQHLVLPSEIAPILNVIAQLGVVLYMLIVGLELDLDAVLTKAKSTLLISNAGIVLPFALGAALAYLLYSGHAPAGVGLMPFMLFFGISLSITAFPVLARILDDLGMQRTTLGVVALTCAALNDVTAWCLLALVTSVAGAGPRAVTTIALTFAYVAAMLIAGRALIARVIAGFDVTTLLALAFLSAIVTELLGVHAIFGAFLLGAIVPYDSGVARETREQLASVVRVLLLPVFFAFTGLRTEIGLLQTAWDWMLCATIIAAATAGKVGGVTLAARSTGLSWRDSTALGILMNTRGLVELIVLNIGLDLGVISPQLFTMLVIMAIVTTMMTSPWLSRIVHSSAHAVRAA